MGALGGGTCTCAIARAIWCVAAWSPYHSSPHHSTACRTTSSPIAPHHRMSHRIPFLSGSVAPHHSSWSPPQFMVPPTPACISWWGAVICMRWSATTAPAPLPDPFPRACPLPPTPCPGLALHHEFLHGWMSCDWLFCERTFDLWEGGNSALMCRGLRPRRWMSCDWLYCDRAFDLCDLCLLEYLFHSRRRARASRRASWTSFGFIYR